MHKRVFKKPICCDCGGDVLMQVEKEYIKVFKGAKPVKTGRYSAEQGSAICNNCLQYDNYKWVKIK